MKRKPINKLVYFDTSTYNRLLDKVHELQQVNEAISNRTIRIFISFMNLQEFSSTYEKTPDRAQELFQLSWDICLHRPTQSTPLLINAEIRHLIEPSVRINIYSNDRGYKDKFMSWWNVLDEKKEIDTICQEIKTYKSKFYHEMVSKKPNLKKIIESNNIDSFDKFLTFAVNQSNMADKIINKELLKDAKIPQEITVDVVKENLSNLSELKGVRHYLYGRLGLIYYHNVVGKPKIGDSCDMHHALYAGYSDIFVSTDVDLIKYLRNVPGDKHQYLNLEEFLKYLYEK